MDLSQIPNGEFVIYGTLTVTPGTETRAASLITQIATQVKSHQGTVYYCITQDPANPRLFHLFERYTGKDAFVEHAQLPLVKELFGIVDDFRPVFVEVAQKA
ncbi:hypothetical protein ASPCAL05027 [Aspergillus calidoustus]|uniref:ABM domain-containing protein n=1 Tax=Aspergillus calidoustus TaxID=454130 RepID=A0A0U5FWG4_ASPCI|nr:hypothetical protein ASPCAL05027 [Aspergillus calidoustus]